MALARMSNLLLALASLPVVTFSGAGDSEENLYLVMSQLDYCNLIGVRLIQENNFILPCLFISRFRVPIQGAGDTY